MIYVYICRCIDIYINNIYIYILKLIKMFVDKNLH